MLANEPASWLEIVERLGVATGGLMFCGFIVLMVLRTILPAWRKRIEAQNTLTIALSTELPKIAKNTESVAQCTQRAFEHQIESTTSINAKLHTIESHIVPRRPKEEG